MISTSTLIMVSAVALLFLVYVGVAEVHRRRSVRRAESTAWDSCEQRVADELNRLRAELRSARTIGDRTSTQLARCRETLRKVLGDIEVLE
jgi:uncharacterized protein YlxW (UPF0749 family)